MTRQRSGQFLLTAVGCFMVAGISLLPSTGRDDSHITYWAAYALGNFGEIVNYSGDRVEQSSSLLQTVILAIADRLTPMALTEVGWLSAVLFGIWAIWLSTRLARALELRGGRYAPLLVATSPYFVYWSFSGMETSLTTAAATYFLLSSTRYLVGTPRSGNSRIGHVVASSALCLLSRPELGAVVVGWLVACGALLLLQRRSRGGSDPDGGPSLARLGVLTIVVLAWALVIVVFRLLYFGSAVPNPVLAKIDGDFLESLTSGWLYFYDHAFHRAVIVPSSMALLSVAWISWKTVGRPTSRAFVLASLCAWVASQLSFVLLAGGDWMEGGRFFVPIVPVTAVLFVTAAEHLRGPVGNRALTALIAVQLLGVVVVFTTFSSSRPIWAYRSTVAANPLAREYGFSEVMNNVHLRDVPLTNAMVDVVAIVAREKSDRVTILSDYGGMVMYHVARRHFPNVKFVDRFGVTSRDVFECRRYPEFPKTSEGVMAPFGDFIGRNASCGALAVDVVFTQGSHVRLLRRLGYVPVYRQSGVVNGSLSTPRRRVPGDMLVAVRGRYVEAVRSQLNPRTFQWQSPAP